MENFFYNNPVKVFFGSDAVEQLARTLKKSRKKNLLLVYGKSSIKQNGVYDKIVKILNGFNLIDFGGVADPEYSYVEKGIKLAKESCADTIIGIGGCTCMDLAKIIAFGVMHDDLLDYLKMEKTPKNNEALTVVTIPTYPSGGSEIDSASEVDDLPGGHHGSLYGVYANYTCLCPEYTYSLDAENTAYAGIVTFLQASVSFLGGSCEIPDGMTKVILKTIISSLNVLLTDPENYSARANQMWASAMTTMGILACGKNEVWANSIYEEIEYIRRLMPISYRRALTIFFPRWLLSRAKYHEAAVYRYVHEILGVKPRANKSEAILEGYNKMISVLEKYNLPAYLNDLGKVPSDKKIMEDIDLNPSDELSDDDVFKAIKMCIK